MKIPILAGFFSFAFLFIWLNLFRMQVIEYHDFREKSENNRIRPVVLEAPRGLIFDRNGKEIVGNRLSFNCYVIPHKGQDALALTFKKLSSLVGENVSVLEDRYKKNKQDLFQPVLLAKDLDKEKAIRIEEEQENLPGVFVSTYPIREYHLAEKAASVTGYVGVINPNEFTNRKDFGYLRNDRLGRDGIEKKYESYLKGENGASQFEVDHRGRLLRILSIQERESGKQLDLTIDSELQSKAYELLDGRIGGLAMMELDKGGLLALASSPSYDPNLFVQSGRNSEKISALLNDKSKPLLNRMISGEYPPGSTFKMITALAGLESGSIDGNTQFFCPGVFTLGSLRLHCWYHAGHGSQSLTQALQHSCNVFFCNTGVKAGVDRIEKTAELFQLGNPTGIDLPYEKKGVVPGQDWKKKTFQNKADSSMRKWYVGETANYSIGQGYLLTTPIQMLRVIGILATNGKVLLPYLVDKIDHTDVSPKAIHQIKLNPDHLKLVKKGMELVVQSDTGTGQRAASKDYLVAGKTGTAQAPPKEDHAWFVGYAPSDNPKVAVVAFLEHGGHGGGGAAEAAGKLLQLAHEKGYF